MRENMKNKTCTLTPQKFEILPYSKLFYKKDPALFQNLQKYPCYGNHGLNF